MRTRAAAYEQSARWFRALADQVTETAGRIGRSLPNGVLAGGAVREVLDEALGTTIQHCLRIADGLEQLAVESLRRADVCRRYEQRVRGVRGVAGCLAGDACRGTSLARAGDAVPAGTVGDGVSGDTSIQVEPVRCRAATAQWRSAADWTAATVRAVTQRCDDLLLADALDVVPGYGGELAQELHLAADLLDATAVAVQLVGFDVTSTHLSGPLSVRAALLHRTLHDAVGLCPGDLADPAPFDQRVTAHFGDVPLFGPGGPLIGDVHQGSLGDCWLIAALASVAEADPARLERMITDNSDGTYTVTIDGTEITVDDEFPVTWHGAPMYATGRHRTEPAALWPLVLEKAVAVHLGEGYEGLARDDVGRAFDLLGEPGELTVERQFAFNASETEVLDRIDTALDAGLPVVATSDEDFGMGDVHAWSVVATGLSAAGVATVTIRNPWGTTGFEFDGDQVQRSDDEEVLEGVDAHEVHIDEDAAEMTIPLSAFTDEFRELDLLESWDRA